MRLITNVDYATIQVPGADQGVRCNASAILLCVPLPFEADAKRDPEGPGEIRATGPDSALPVFGHKLDCKWSEYEIEDAVSPHIFITDSHPEGRPLMSGAILTFKDGTVLTLSTTDYDRPLDFMDLPDDYYPQVWPILWDKVHEYHTAPYMGLYVHVPTDEAKSMKQRLDPWYTADRV